MLNVMVNVLIGIYAIAWAWCFTDARAGMLFLVLAAGFVCLPFFVSNIVKLVAVNVFVSVLLTIVSILIPPLGVLVLIWVAIATIMKFGRFIRNIPAIVVGVLLYVAAAIVPHALRASTVAMLNGFSLFLVQAFMLAAGGLTVIAALRLGGLLGYRRPLAAALMLGFTAYIALFVITFMLPGTDGDADIDIGDD